MFRNSLVAFKFHNSNKQQQQQRQNKIISSTNFTSLSSSPKKPQITKMSATMSNKWLCSSLLLGSCAILIIATLAQAQYNTYDSDSNSDSDGNPILSNSEIGKLVRGSSGRAARGNSLASAGAQHSHQHYQPQQNLAATRNLYNRQQPLQHAQTHNYRQSSFGRGSSDNSDADSDEGSSSAMGSGGYNPASSHLMGAASHGRSGSSNADNDDDEGANYGPNFDSNVDTDESSPVNADGQPMNLNQAASGYPGHNEGYGVGETAGANYGGSAGFGGASGYGPSSFEGSEFGPSESGFAGGEGRRAKSASSLMGMRGFGGNDDDAGAPQYGPNSAINAGGSDEDETRANYAPEATQNEADDDE